MMILTKLVSRATRRGMSLLIVVNFVGIVDFSCIMVWGVLGVLEGELGHYNGKGEAGFLGVAVLVPLLKHNIFLWWRKFRKLKWERQSEMMIGRFQTIWRVLILSTHEH